VLRVVTALFLVTALSGCAAAPASEIPAPIQSAKHEVILATQPKSVPLFDKTTFSLDAADSPWVVADKLRPLNPKKYKPAKLVTLKLPHRYDPRLRSNAAGAYAAMYAAAKADGVSFVILSAYRSYKTQVSVYNGWVERLGKAKADLQSARPGFSEHQIGLSVDIAAGNGKCTIAACFGTTPEGRWLTEHAWEYGWVLRYPKGKTHITGYKYEPWHWRYVGRGLAAEIHKTPNITLEEFFGLPAAPDYAK
jgi:D-alanyl-D-alanine carboxypeptidase